VEELSKLTGKVAVVTGASKGIGAAIAKELAAAGAAVVVNYASSKEGADRVVAEIESAGGKAIAAGGDVSKLEDVKALFAKAKDAYGSVDILVNNAGIYGFSPLETISAEHFHQQFDINVLGLLLATQEGVTLFPETGGSIINIGSAVTAMPIPATAVYAATKSAVEAITHVLAKELGPRKIRVNQINPGPVETEGTHAAGMMESDMLDEIVAQAPLGRIGQPKDIADIAVFLASADSNWLTGEILIASGGLR